MLSADAGGIDELVAMFEAGRCAEPRRDPGGGGRDRGALARPIAGGDRVGERVSSPDPKDYSHALSALWQERPARYSRALLETLALIAYRQPISRGEIEEVRGVSVSSSIMKTLVGREWVRVVGHREAPGRPALYGTTRNFLDTFNLKSLESLPPLARLKDLDEPLPDLFSEVAVEPDAGAGTEAREAAAVDEEGAASAGSALLSDPECEDAVEPDAGAGAGAEAREAAGCCRRREGRRRRARARSGNASRLPVGRMVGDQVAGDHMLIRTVRRQRPSGPEDGGSTEEAAEGSGRLWAWHRGARSNAGSPPGGVSVNGHTAALGARVTTADVLRVDGKPVRRAGLRHRIIRYHKPAGEVTARRDPLARPTVFDRLPALGRARVDHGRSSGLQHHRPAPVHR